VEAFAKRDICEETSLFKKFMFVVESLQVAFDESHETAKLNDSMEKTSDSERIIRDRIISSSAEVMIVNTVLVSLRDLLEAMSGLAKVVMRFQAHRVVHRWETSYYHCCTPDFLHGREKRGEYGQSHAERMIEYDSYRFLQVDGQEVDVIINSGGRSASRGFAEDTKLIRSESIDMKLPSEENSSSIANSAYNIEDMKMV